MTRSTYCLPVLLLATLQTACRTCDRHAIDFSPIEDGEWPVSSPRAQGLDPERVTDPYCDASMLDDVYSVLMIKNGHLVAEAYFNDGSVDDRSNRQSVTKSFTSAMVGLAVEQGLVAMQEDEQAIRLWFEDWMRATTEGDLELARSLIAADAVFLVPGAGQREKESFAAAATASDPNLAFELDCEIQEIEVLGDHAWLWTKLSLTMTDRRTELRSTMAGHSLSILKRQGEDWVVVRDANTMVPVDQDG